VGQVPCHHRDQRDERGGEERHHRDRADRGPAGRLAPRCPQARPQRGEQAVGPPRGRRQADERERQHDREERHCVRHERHRVPERGHRGAGQCRAHDAAEVELSRVQRDRREELRLRHQVRQDRLLERPDQGGRRALQRDQQHQRRRAVVAGRDQNGEQDRGQRRGQVSDDQHRAPRQPVGERAADRRQQPDRQERPGSDQHRPGRLPGVRYDQGTNGDRLHP
jgi:hypothetical protein